MRLIDADELINIMEWNKKSENQGDMITNVNSVINLIKNRPTAYDVDKVVEQLEDESEIYCREYGKEDELYLQGAIEIVKGGGVE